MNDREVFPNAPVVLVAYELRHPVASALSRSAVSQIKQYLAPELPINRPVTRATVRAIAGGPADVREETLPSYASRDRMTAVTFGPESIVVETTNYERYERFRSVIELALEARQAVDGVDGVERIGLRYIDEIRVPDGDGTGIAWRNWVDGTLLGPAEKSPTHGLEATQWQGIVSFNSGDDKTVVLRYGPREGYAVDPEGPLKRSVPLPGPFFLLDIDSFWTPSELPEFDLQQVLDTTDRLRDPVRGLFEDLITEKLRSEVLRNVG